MLLRHWPAVPQVADVKEAGAHNLAHVDVVAGGFPCQDVSAAGKKAGVELGERSGLWGHFYRIICELQPRYIIVENVDGLRHAGRGMHRVLGDLAAGGYDATWDRIPACAFGAHHRRYRIFIVAHARSLGRRDALWPQFFTGITPQKSGGWVPAGMLEPVSLVGVTYPGVPAHLRVADGFAGGLDAAQWSPACRQQAWNRVKASGNAVVPAVAEYVGRRLVTMHHFQQVTPA